MKKWVIGCLITVVMVCLIAIITVEPVLSTNQYNFCLMVCEYNSDYTQCMYDCMGY